MKLDSRAKKYITVAAILLMVAMHWVPDIIPYKGALLTNITVVALLVSAWWVLNSETE